MKKMPVGFVAALLLLAVIVPACQLSAAQPEPTATPLPPTATATATLEPTATFTPLPTEIPLPTATPDRTATQAAEDIVMMQKELAEYGLTADNGHLAWRGFPVPLTVTEYLETSLYEVTDEEVKDFILKANVKWDTTSGLAGCSILFRQDGEFETENRYEFIWMRLQGAPAWDIERMEFGKFMRNVSLQVNYDTILQDKKGATNEMVLKVVGEEFKVWINGKESMTYTDKVIPAGKISFTSWQETGKTTCTFSDGWLWIIDE